MINTMSSHSDRIILPERGLTLLPPWPQAIVFADKRLENRGASVAGHIGTWRGLVALSQSKTWDRAEAEGSSAWLIQERLATIDQLCPGPSDGWTRWAGKLVAVAELLDILPPTRCEGDPWHVSGQHGLILGQVWEVEPIPIIGGRGCWFAGQCPQCEALQARDRIDGTCRRCGVRPGGHTGTSGFDPRPWVRPELKIVRECTMNTRRASWGAHDPCDEGGDRLR